MEKKLIQTPHIVAFLDFLGASEKMRDPAKNDKFLQMVNAVYTLSLSISGKIKKYDNIKNEIKVKIFSDNIVIAKEIEQIDNCKDIFESYQDIEQFSLIIYTAGMMTGNFIRGAISIGDLYMNDIFVYGEGLLKAHDGESKIANYPRIIIDKEIFVMSQIDMWQTFTPPDKKNIILRDMDGELYLNPFYGLNKIANGKKTEIIKKLNTVHSYIIKEYKDLFSKNKKNVFPKLYWLAEKFNDYCIVNKHSHRINLDQLTLEDEQ